MSMEEEIKQLQDKTRNLEKKIKMLESELGLLYKENRNFVKMYSAIQELQELHEAPAAKFTYYLR